MGLEFHVYTINKSANMKKSQETYLMILIQYCFKSSHADSSISLLSFHPSIPDGIQCPQRADGYKFLLVSQYLCVHV